MLTSKSLTVTLIFEMDVKGLKGNSYSGQDLLGGRCRRWMKAVGFAVELLVSLTDCIGGMVVT